MPFRWSTQLPAFVQFAVAVFLLPGVSQETEIIVFKPAESTSCINSQFVRTLSLQRDLQCPFECAVTANCQAWSWKRGGHHPPLDGPGTCRLFVFDRCSKAVRDCGCTAAQPISLFVKQQEGVVPPSMCPSGYASPKTGGYADTLCDRRYRMFPGYTSWQAGVKKCQSEPGLTIMADVTSWDELHFVCNLSVSLNKIFMVSGVQKPGSPEPGNNSFYWTGCNIPVNPAFWATGQPSDGATMNENITGVYDIHGLHDFPDTTTSFHGVLCECLSPF